MFHIPQLRDSSRPRALAGVPPIDIRVTAGDHCPLDIRPIDEQLADYHDSQLNEILLLVQEANYRLRILMMKMSQQVGGGEEDGSPTVVESTACENVLAHLAIDTVCCGLSRLVRIFKGYDAFVLNFVVLYTNF